MELFYLIMIILGISSQNILKKSFTKKAAGKGVYTFSLITSLSGMGFFILTSRDLSWNSGLIPFALFFALSFSAATVFGTLAISCGELSLTSLVTSFSLMIPTFYGLIFLREPITIGLIPGLILLAASLILINKKQTQTVGNAKWLIYVLIAFAGNGMCSVVQKMQQSTFCGAYKNEFMILSLAFVCAIMCIAATLSERRHIAVYTKSGWHFALAYGVMNGTVNLFVMILSGLMSVSLMFPLISVGGIVVTFIISKLFYKETLTKAQHIGFLLGIAAVIFLNL